MHIAIVGPIATADIAPLLDADASALPRGYEGAPLLVTLIAELLRRGHRVTAITLSAGMALSSPFTVQARRPGLQLTYVPMRRRAWRPNGLRPGRIVDLYALERRGLVDAIHAASPDVAHAHWAYEFALATLASGVPHVVTCHDAPYEVLRLTRSAYRGLRLLMARRALRQARFVSTVSPYMLTQVQAMTEVPISVVPNPVDPKAFALSRQRDLGAAPQVAMVCNGWGTRKNPEPALQAFSLWRQRRPSAQLHLYGHDFQPGGRAQAWVTGRGIGAGMHFHGAMPHSALLQALGTHHALIHPSLEESFGMVLAEAMAMGLPVIAGERSGAVPWVVGKGGLLCDVRSHNALAAALDELLDPQRYARMSADGIESMRARFSAQAVADSFLGLYRQALQRALQASVAACAEGSA